MRAVGKSVTHHGDKSPTAEGAHNQADTMAGVRRSVPETLAGVAHPRTGRHAPDTPSRAGWAPCAGQRAPPRPPPNPTPPTVPTVSLGHQSGRRTRGSPRRLACPPWRELSPAVVVVVLVVVPAAAATEGRRCWPDFANGLGGDGQVGGCGGSGSGKQRRCAHSDDGRSTSTTRRRLSCTVRWAVGHFVVQRPGWRAQRRRPRRFIAPPRAARPRAPDRPLPPDPSKPRPSRPRGRLSTHRRANPRPALAGARRVEGRGTPAAGAGREGGGAGGGGQR